MGGNLCILLGAAVVIWFCVVQQVAANLVVPKDVEALVKQKIGQDCKNDVECTSKVGELSQCNLTTRVCECQPDAAVGNMDGEPNTKCLIGGVHIRDRCEDTADCVGIPGTSSVCKKTGVCDCMSGFLPSINLDNCLEFQNQIGGNCEESQQCSAGSPGLLSECIEGQCKCKSEAVSNNDNICYMKATKVGAECEVDIQCTENLGLLSHCLNGTNRWTCECEEGAVTNRDRSGCHVKKNLGEDCVVGECEDITQAACHDGKCKCGEGYSTNPNTTNTCMRLATRIGEWCGEDDSQCGELVDANCDLNYYCSCNSTTQVESQDGKGCLPQMINLTDSCTEIQQCQVTNSNCTSNKCSCASGYVEGVENPNKCLRIRDYFEDPCDEDIQCQGIGDPQGTIPCHLGDCRCETPQKELMNGICVSARKLEESCTSTDECIAGGTNMTWCTSKNDGGSDDSKWCQCKGENTVIVDDQCWDLKRVGDACEIDNECNATIQGNVGCRFVMNDGTVSRECSCLEENIQDENGVKCGRSGANSFLSQFSIICALALVLITFSN